jgi:hypothetical protein
VARVAAMRLGRLLRLPRVPRAPSPQSLPPGLGASQSPLFRLERLIARGLGPR